MRIDVDRELCVGSGMCVHALPDTFDQSEQDGRVLLVRPGPGVQAAAAIEALRTVAESCPVAAISLVEY
ncbi:ferredoxin [Streptomyces sp. NPDC004647]|uniref:ferredoxin n=1 Tax=Streptomyces sp. NPDC004647 TaxID=3154671 RepID=UPI0033B70497